MIIKKSTGILSFVALLIGLFAVICTAQASGPKIEIGSVSSPGGEVVVLPISLSDNTGICGATLTFSFDEALTMTDISKGDALSSLTMTKPGKMTVNPFKLVWDGIEQDSSSGVIAYLSFDVPEATGEYIVSITYSEGDVVDNMLNPVNPIISNGKITVSDDGEPDNFTINVKSMTALPGTTIDVPVCFNNNTGVCGATLSVNYDSGLMLKDITSGSALTSLTMTKPGKLDLNPFNLVWDGIEQDTTDGDVVHLLFEVPKMAGEYNIEVSFEYGDIVDGKLNPLMPTVENGIITVTGEAVSDELSITVSSKSTLPNQIVEIPVILSGNTGICGATLSFEYDSALTLDGIAKGSALSSLSMTKPGRLDINPFTVVWDGLEEDSSSGTMVVLTFTAPDKTGVYDISVTYGDGDIVDGKLNPVNVKTISGDVKVVSEEQTADILVRVGENQVTLTGNSRVESSVYIAFYTENGAMTSVKICNPDDGIILVSADEKAAYASVMWLSKSCKPLCEAKEINIK